MRGRRSGWKHGSGPRLTCWAGTATVSKLWPWPDRSRASWRPAPAWVRPVTSGGCCSPSSAGRTGRPDLAQRLLAPMLSSGTASREKAAQAVLRAVDGPHADIRLQIIVLQAELEAPPATAEDDQLRLPTALADAYDDLGIYPQALGHGHQELALASAFSTPTTPAPWPPWATSRPGLASAGTRPGRCACPPRCCPTWSGSWVPATPTPWPPGATSRPGLASAGMRPGRCAWRPGCCPTRIGPYAHTTPAP